MVSNVWQVRRQGHTIRLALLLTTAMGTAALATAPSTANDWIGTIGSWLDTANWDAGVPGSGTTAVISNGGTAEIENGATAISQATTIADGAGSSGTVNISGGSSWSGGHLALGVSGNGTINVSSGGRLTTTNAFIGENAGSTGTLTLEGSGTNWTTSGFFGLGRSGSGSLTISNGATFNSGSAVQLGNAVESSGAVTVAGAGSKWISAQNVTVGVSGEGRMTISDGGTVSSIMVVLGDNAAGRGDLTVDGAGSALTASSILHVGRLGTGTMTVSNGGLVSNTQGYVGHETNSSGAVRLTGAGTTWSNSGILGVGYSGTGVLEASGGAAVTNTTGMIGYTSGSNGAVTVSGAGSTWSNSLLLDIGSRGTGSLNIRDGGSVTAASEIGVLLASNAGSIGTISIGGLENAAAAGAGKLTTNQISFGDGAGKLVFNHTDTNHIFSAALSGNGTINHKAGTTVLTGDGSAFGGTINLTGGNLVVGNGTSGTLGGTLLASSGTLSGTGTLSATIISAGASHAPGNSIGTQTINGNYVNNGTLVIEAGPASADKLIVNGTVDITTATLDVRLAGSGWDIAHSPYVYTIIENDAADAIVGTFNLAPDKHLFLQTSLDYAAGTGNDLALTVARNSVSFASLAGSDAQSAVAQAIENLGSGELYDAIVALGSQDLVQQSFEALSGQIHGSAGTTLVGNGKMLGQTANNRMQGSSEPAGSGAAPVLAYGPGGPELVAPDSKLGVIWSSGFGARGSTEGNTAGSSLDTGSAGIAAGMDGQFGDWRLGALAGYSNSGFNAKDGNSNGGSNNYSVGLYGGTEWGDFAFRSSLAYTWHDLSTRRSVSVGGFTDQLSARYGAHAIQASGEVSYGFDVTNAARFEPFANLTHVRMATDGYSESGGAAALTNAAAVTNTTFTTLGIRASQKFAVGTVLATVNGMLGWEHGMGDLTPKNTSSFAGGPSFTATGTEAAADTALVSAGIDLNLSEAATIGFTYDGRFARGNYNNGVTAKVKILF